MPRWWPRPRGQLVRQVPEWFNDYWYQAGDFTGVTSTTTTGWQLYNSGSAPVLLPVYGLWITATFDVIVNFGFLPGASGTHSSKNVAQTTSQAAPAGQLYIANGLAFTANVSEAYFPAGSWLWPYSYPIATVEPNFSYVVTLKGAVSSTSGTCSITFWWVEGSQGYNP